MELICVTDPLAGLSLRALPARVACPLLVCGTSAHFRVFQCAPVRDETGDGGNGVGISVSLTAIFPEFIA